MHIVMLLFFIFFFLLQIQRSSIAPSEVYTGNYTSDTRQFTATQIETDIIELYN